MAKHFECPQCSKRYPILPTLFNRKVRCTDCGTIFMLQRDLTVQVVGSKPAEVPEEQLVEQAAAGDSGKLEEMRSLTRTWMQDATKRIDKQKTSKGKAAAKRVAAMRDKMSQNLSAAADAAAQATAIHKPMAAETPVGKPAAFQPVLEDGKRDGITHLPLIIVAILLASGTGIWWLLQDSPAQAAMRAYGAHVSGTQLKYPHRHRDHLARTWAPQNPAGEQPLIILNGTSARFANEIVADGNDVSALIATRLPDAWPIDRLKAFAIGRDAGTRAPELVAAQSNDDALRESLNAQGLNLISYDLISEALQGDNIPTEIADAAMRLLMARDTNGQPTATCQRLLSGDWPSKWHLLPFEHQSAQCLTIRNRRYATDEIPCRGNLLQLTGAGWPEEWRLLNADALPRNLDDLPEY